MVQVLPLRPLTVAELLDASVVLLRRCGLPLVALGLVLAAGQQALSVAVRQAAPGGPFDGPAWWVWLCLWLGTESTVVAVLAAPASVGAARTLLATAGAPTQPGRDPLDRRTLLTAPGARWPAVLFTAAVLGGLATAGALLCGLPWLLAYGATGLVVPVLVADRAPGSAVLRPFSLLARGSFRAAGVRLLGWLGWLAIRLAVGFAGTALVASVDSVWLSALPWVVVDALAYPALACLDACVHLENRMRVEGLDIALGRPGAWRAGLESVR